jgi:hypothetical protein
MTVPPYTVERLLTNPPSQLKTPLKLLMEIYGPKLGPCQILEPLSFNNPSYLRKVSRPKATNQEGFYYTRFGQYANSPPTFTGVGHQ